MSSVDDRIVNMQFNNKDFQAGVTSTQRSLTDLEKTISTAGKSQGLQGMAQAVQENTSRFGAMKIAGVAAIATIASKATSLGLGLIKSLTLDPLMQGFQEYNLNLQSIQTIVANTGAKVSVVNGYLQKLNTYSDQTIYNFSQMAKNIGTFTAAGVGLKTSVAAIQGISNIAALAGSSSEQASTAMYQLSQAISAGRVNLQDWNSVVNAGMGGKKLQTALIQTGIAMGTVDGKTVSLGKNIKIAGESFRNSISAKAGGESWLTSDVLVKTLALMDGRLSKAAISANILAKGNHTVAEATEIANKKLEAQQKLLLKQGFTKEQVKSLTTMANAAYESATVVKTLPQLLDVTKEQIGSVWSNAFRLIVGGFGQSKKMWTEASTSIGNVIKGLNNGLNDLIIGWKRGGGRIAVIEGFKSGFSAIGKILGTVKMAFQDVFPPGAGKGLAEFSKGFANLMSFINPSKATLENLRSIFGGIFAVMHIGITIVKAIGAAFGGFFGALNLGAAGAAGGGILAFLGKIGEMLKSADKFLTSGDKMIDAFRKIGDAAGGFASKGIGIARDLIAGIVSGLDPGALKTAMVSLATNIIESIKSALGIHSPAASMVPVGVAIVQGIVQGIISIVGYLAQAAGQLVGALFGGIRTAFSGFSALDFASLLNAILTGGLLYTFNKISFQLKNFSSVFLGVFGQLASNLKTFQNSLRAKMLLDIAIAVGILAASLIGLSLVDPKKLAVGVGVIGSLMGELVGTMAVLSKISKGDVGLASLAGTMLLISGAMIAMATAVAILGALDLKSVIQGVVAIGAVMAIMTKSLASLAGLGPVAEGAAGGMVLMATAMVILAGAIALFGNMKAETLAVGFIAVGVALKLMVGAMQALGTNLVGTLAAAAGMVAAATAMTILAAAVALFGNMDMGTLVKGFLAVGIALTLMVGAMETLGANLTGTLAAAAAMVLVSTALAMLVPVIFTLGNMSWETLLKGMGALVGLIIIFTAALTGLGVVAYYAGPALLMLGAAIALIGIGMAAFGAGFALLAATGVAGIAVMTAAIAAFIGLLPAIAAQLAAAFVSFVEVIAQATPRLRTAFATIFQNLIGVVTDSIPVIANMIGVLLQAIVGIIIDFIPQVGNVFSTLIHTGLRVIRSTVPDFIETGWFLLNRFLQSFASHIGEVADNATKIITAWIRAIGRNAPKVADAGLDAIVDFINGMADAIDSHASDLRKAGLNMALAVANGLSGGLLSEGVRLVKNAAEEIASHLPGWMRKVLHISSPSKVTMEIGKQVSQGLAIGISTHSVSVQRSAEGVANAALDKMKLAMERMSEVVDADVDVDPVITPVLDLNKFRKDTSQMSSLLAVTPLTANVSFDQASVISATQSAAKDDSAGNSQNGSEIKVDVNLTQNNNSPTALSEIEIYRRTNNQLSLAKDALEKVTAAALSS